MGEVYGVHTLQRCRLLQDFNGAKNSCDHTKVFLPSRL